MVGVFPQFRRDPAGFLVRTAREFGDIAYFKLGPQHMYLLTRPDYVQDVLVNDHPHFEKSRIMKRAKMLLGEGLLTSEGQFHLRQRRLSQPAFHRQRIAGYGSVMVDYAERTASRWRDGETVNVAEEMMRLTLAIVAKTLFSADVESEAGDIGQALTDVFSMFDLMLVPYAEVLLQLPLPTTRKFERAKQRLDRTVYRIIGEHRAAGQDRGDLLSMLLMAQDEQGDGGQMTDQQVRDEALTIFLAGHETTANLLTWTWYLLSQHPEVESRLHAELGEVLGGRTPSIEDIPRLPFTEKVIYEALRMYPPAWAISRMVVKDWSIGGYDIPVGSIIIVSPYVMHRREEFFPEPDRFHPDRWTPELRDSLPRFAFFPFGGGVRICIGERFAWMEAILILAAIAQKWKLRLDPAQQVAMQPQITLRTKHGMRMQVVGR
jgi:cytochrome P450